MKKLTLKSNDVYTADYFTKRDNLDPRMATAVKIFMHIHNLKKVLDVGCGTGKLVAFLKKNGFEAFGCDVEKEAIKAAYRFHKIRVVKASATRLPFKKNTFDVITSIAVIEHLTPDEVDQFLTEAKRVLKPHGAIFLVTPNYASPIRLIRGKKWFGFSDPTHINFYTPTSLENVLKKHKLIHFQTRFTSKYNLPFDWDLPGFFRILPAPLYSFFNYLLIATPLANIRNSFWMIAQKSE